VGTFVITFSESLDEVHILFTLILSQFILRAVVGFFYSVVYISC